MFKDKLIDDELWKKFLERKISKNFIPEKDKKILENFVQKQEYKTITLGIYNKKYKFSTPIKHVLNKNHGNKKRIVYTYQPNEMIILKYISFLLYDYDYLFSKNLYSFRKDIGVKDAVRSLLRTKNIKNMYGYKVDIKNYFNSVNKDILLKNLKKDIKDKDLYNLFYELLSNEFVSFNGLAIKEKKGVIAGSPLSAFLANYYLKKIDEYFWKKDVFYARYADDIIIFAKSKKEINEYKNILYEFLDKYKLEVNKDKEHFYDKGEAFEFLGFSFQGNVTDLSKNTIYKMKKKIKRKCRAYRRWMLKNDVDYKVTLKAINRRFNRKFYGNDNTELSWKYWFFPVINTDKGLKIIDRYFQETLRYLVTGKYSKKNYKALPYEMLKKCNYKPLVNEYYKTKKDLACQKD